MSAFADYWQYKGLVLVISRCFASGNIYVSAFADYWQYKGLVLVISALGDDVDSAGALGGVWIDGARVRVFGLKLVALFSGNSVA